MKAARIISDIEATGARLITHGGGLRLVAAPGIVTPDMLAEVRAHKAEIIDLLTRMTPDIQEKWSTAKEEQPALAGAASSSCWDCQHMDKSGVFFPGLCRQTGEEIRPEIVDTGCQSFSPAPLLARAMGYGCGGCHCKTYLRTPAGWQCEGCGFVFEVIGGTVGPLPIRWH